MNKTELTSLLNGLLLKSAKDEINWKDASEFSVIKNTTQQDFAFSTPEFTLEIYKPDSSRTNVYISIFNSKAELVTNIEPSDIDEENTMNQILNLARSKSVNEKEVLDTIIKSLEGDEILGDRKGPHEETDIPF